MVTGCGKKTDQHVQYLTALWGKTTCDMEDELTHEGQVTPHANPWLQQAWLDLKGLNSIDGGKTSQSMVAIASSTISEGKRDRAVLAGRHRRNQSQGAQHQHLATRLLGTIRCT